MTQFSEHITDDGGDADDGVLEDSAEAVVGAMENLANSDIVQKVVEAAGPAIGAVHDTLREGAKHTTEAVHRAARAGGVVSRGMPETKDAEEVAEGYVEAIETKAEDLAEGLTQSAGGVFDTLREKAPAAVLDAVGPSGAVEEAVEECAKQVGETAMEVMGEAAIEEIAESVAEVIPGVGVVGPSCHLILGTGKAAAGVSSLLTGGVIAVVGGVYGAAAALFDGGAAWGKVMNVSRGPSGWGASMAAEGGLIATKGAVGYVGQVCTACAIFCPPPQEFFLTLSCASIYPRCRWRKSAPDEAERKRTNKISIHTHTYNEMPQTPWRVHNSSCSRK